MAERGANLGATTTGLLRLLDCYGAELLDRALGAALLGGAVHLAAVRQLLDQTRHSAQQAPPVAVALPDDPRLRDVVVRPHELSTYDQLTTKKDDDDDTH